MNQSHIPLGHEDMALMSGNCREDKALGHLIHVYSEPLAGIDTSHIMALLFIS